MRSDYCQLSQYNFREMESADEDLNFNSISISKWYIWSSHVYICKYLSKDQQFQHCLIRQRLLPFLWKLPFLSYIDTLIYTTLQPRTRQTKWYHFWPDWPTGPLRVEFRNLSVHQIFFCCCFRSRALFFSSLLYSLVTRPLQKIEHWVDKVNALLSYTTSLCLKLLCQVR